MSARDRRYIPTYPSIAALSEGAANTAKAGSIANVLGTFYVKSSDVGGWTALQLPASVVSVLDTAGLLTATDVEAALLEHQNRLATNVIADPGNAGAIPVVRSGSCALVSTGAQTRTLAIPGFKGQRLFLYDDTHAGNIVVTASQAVNQAGNNTLTFGAVRDNIELVAITVGGALRWQVASNDGVALSTV